MIAANKRSSSVYVRISLIACLTLLAWSPPTYADDAVIVPDPALLKWQLASDGKVYLRNLNEFDPTFLGCCYNFSIDLATTVGKNLWAALLTQIAMGKPLYLFVSNKAQPSPVTILGN